VFNSFADSVATEETVANSNTTQQPAKNTRKRRELTPLLRKNMQLEKHFSSHEVKPPCDEKGLNKCGFKISDVLRVIINEQYWNMGYNDRGMFILNSCKRRPTSRKTTEQSRRKHSLYYYIVSADG